MIDVKQLRIGNWILARYGGIMQVSYLSFTDIDSYPEHYSPIPLTPDILGKIKGCMVDIAFCGIGDFIIIHYYDTQKKVLFNGNYVGIIHLQYLHQLQNLYSCLTGKELEIEL